MKGLIKDNTLTPFIGEELLIWPNKSKRASFELFEANTKAIYESGESNNTILYADNLKALQYLIPIYKNKINLIYIDPPFESQANYEKKIILKDGLKLQKFSKQQYTDRWEKYEYLQFIYERLQLLYTLLAPTGSIYVHCDWRKSHHIRLMLDEIFGEEQFRNEIIWKRGTVKGAKAKGNQYARNHDTIFYYTKSNDYTFHRQYIPFDEKYKKRFNRDDNDGKGPYRSDQAIGTRSKDSIELMKATGKIFVENNKQKIKTYLHELKGIVLDDNWSDISEVNVRSKARTMYPTQKPEELLQRIIQTSSNEGDLVLDCFSGSGTTVCTAAKLGREFIGIDNNIGAIQTTVQRLNKLETPFKLKEIELETPFLEVDYEIVYNHENRLLEIIDIDITYLQQQLDISIKDWKQVVEFVQIDWSYDGAIFKPKTFDCGAVATTISALYENLDIEVADGTEVAIMLTDIFGNQSFITVKI